MWKVYEELGCEGTGLTQNLPTTGPRSMLEATFTIPVDVRMHMHDPFQETCTFRYANPVHALVNMLHFNPLAEDWDNLCFGYEPQPFYDDFCNGDRVRRIQVHTCQLLSRCPDSLFPTTPTVFLTGILSPSFVVLLWFPERGLCLHHEGSRTRQMLFLIPCTRFAAGNATRRHCAAERHHVF